MTGGEPQMVQSLHISSDCPQTLTINSPRCSGSLFSNMNTLFVCYGYKVLPSSHHKSWRKHNQDNRKEEKLGLQDWMALSKKNPHLSVPVVFSCIDVVPVTRASNP